ncbi:hypothetical protein [Companilactobacillus zhachilii]|uniref:hypothetical protein n=1 Tax=Companilactobacillus zhachilii TaxID=2304606 RepID=UPI0040341EFC
MFQELKNKFMQAAFLTSVWILGLLTIFFGNMIVDLNLFWRILGISSLFAVTFGMIYPYVWNYGTWTAPINIVITTGVNILSGFGAIYLLSKVMFNFIMSYWWEIILLDLILHILMFYFYRKYENKQLVKKLNELKR